MDSVALRTAAKPAPRNGEPRSPRRLRATLLVGVAIVLGAVAWYGVPGLIGLALLMPALWCCARSRGAAFLAVLGYQLAATRGAPTSFAHFYGTLLGLGVLLWLVAALVVAIAWALCWSFRPRRRIAGAAVALLVTAVPPVGIVTWVHPWTTAGAIFPGCGWYGFAAAVGISLGLCTQLSAVRLSVAAVLLLSAGIAFERPAATVPTWRGVDTHYIFGQGGADPLRDFERQLSLAATVRAERNAAVILLPESAGGHWTDATAALWSRELGPTTSPLVLLGGEVSDAGAMMANVLIAFDGGRATVIYRERMPVPLSMWRTWANNGTRAYWFSSPVVEVGHRRAAVFICYEQLLVWTAVHSFLNHPDTVVACANDWWCSDSNLPLIQRNCAWSWARLFAVPLVSATNF